MSNPFSPARNESTSSYDAPPADSASMFHQRTDLGDRKTLSRAVWYDLNSLYQAIEGGSYYASSGFGRDYYNYDQPEGYMPRITSNAQSLYDDEMPWASVTGDGTIETESGYIGSTSAIPLNVARTGLLSSEIGKTCITSSGNYRRLRFKNQEGAEDDEVYTNNWTGLTGDGLLSKTPSDGYWHVSWIARKHSGNTGTVRMTMFMFGLGAIPPYAFDGMTGGDVGVNAGSSTTRENPATGGTFYWRQVTLTSQWQYFDFYYKYNGATNLTFQSTRFDVDDGESGGDVTVYIDRPTLHPYNIKLQESGFDGGTNPDTLDDAAFGPYADAYD